MLSINFTPMSRESIAVCSMDEEGDSEILKESSINWVMSLKQSNVIILSS